MLSGLSVPQSPVFSGCIISGFLDRRVLQNEIMSRLVSAYLQMCLAWKRTSNAIFFPSKKTVKSFVWVFKTENAPSLWADMRHQLGPVTLDPLYKTPAGDGFVGTVNKIIMGSRTSQATRRSQRHLLPQFSSLGSPANASQNTTTRKSQFTKEMSLKKKDRTGMNSRLFL